MNYGIFSIGENALTIDFGNEISAELNDLVLKLAEFINQNSFEGYIELVPAYSTLTVFYNVFKVRKAYDSFSTAFEAVHNLIENALHHLDKTQHSISRLLQIPVCFDTEFALDLDFVATENNLSPEKVIEIFTQKTYRVFMLGFLPGFSYMGEVNEQIATPRKLTPRLKVASGSVGIAGKQTGIYSLESPGGWQIIGRTPFKMFSANDEEPVFLRAGDSVKFFAIDKETYTEICNQKHQISK